MSYDCHGSNELIELMKEEVETALFSKWEKLESEMTQLQEEYQARVGVISG